MGNNTSLLTRLTDIIYHCGAYQVGAIPTDQLVVYSEVRDMCKANTCRGYGKTWACPPGVGPIEECLASVQKFDTMLLFSCKYNLEDSFDYEGMMAGMQSFRTLASTLADAIADLLPNHLLLANEGCDKCKCCTYPDAPCRFADRLHPSIEAYGFNVSELAKAANINYINGANTVTYFGALCFDQT